MRKVLNRLCTGVYWKYNVFQGDVPLTTWGKVFYVVDDFGTAIIVHNTEALKYSLKG